MMAVETKTKRLEILSRIRKLENERCASCSGSSSTGDVVDCPCEAAVAIRKCGDELINLTRQSREKRISKQIKQVKKYGLTPELYKILREQEVNIKSLRQILGWSQKKMDEWRRENALYEKAVQQENEIKKRKGTLAEQAGLTVEAYHHAKSIGYLDKEIRGKYKLSKFAMLDFKKRHGLALARGHNSKYRHTNKSKEVAK